MEELEDTMSEVFMGLLTIAFAGFGCFVCIYAAGLAIVAITATVDVVKRGLRNVYKGR